MRYNPLALWGGLVGVSWLCFGMALKEISWGGAGKPGLRWLSEVLWLEEAMNFQIG